MKVDKEVAKVKRAEKKAKTGQIYTKNEYGNVEFKNIEDLIINTVHGELTIQQFIEKTSNQYNELVESNQALINTLENTQFIHPDKTYIVVGLANGYISKGNDYVVECDISESELYKGYCTIKNHKVVIDLDKKEEYIKTLKGVMR